MKTLLIIDIEEICEMLSEEIALLGDFKIVAKHSVAFLHRKQLGRTI